MQEDIVQYPETEPGTPREKNKFPPNFVFLIVAGLLAIAAPFVLFVGSSEGGGIAALTLFTFSSEFTYGWVMPVIGILLILFAILAHKNNMRILSLVNMVLGPILIALPFIIANHWLYKFDENDLSMAELFIGGSSDGWYVYLGGILSIIAGVLAIVFGYRMFKKKEESLE